MHRLAAMGDLILPPPKRKCVTVACNIHPMYRISLLIAASLIFKINIAQVKQYKLIDKSYNSDINNNILSILDTGKRGLHLLNTAFKPIKGSAIVYRFIATYQGESFTGKLKKFHDILIIKTDSQNHILDGFQYTLEWAEQPAEIDLYKINCSKCIIKKNTPIKELGLVPSITNSDRPFEEDGTIILK